ncbi:hypothetical protein QJQ45_027594 [Haematococcus lacustris]|nr:hypothetical protein QJQ45_027594 [Haematococcus lacustris]
MKAGRPTLRIEPFKHPVSMDPGYADKTWKVLEDAIHEIHNQNASGLSFEELYRNGYNMVLHKHGEKLYSGLIQTLTRHLQGIALALEASQGAPFAQELKKRWDDHNKSTQMIRDILMYMDRTFVVQQHRTPVFQLGLELWRDHVVRNKHISDRLSSFVMDAIQRERSGEAIDRGLVRSITQMLVDLGHQVYVDDFEKQFLETSAAFYKVPATKAALQHSLAQLSAAQHGSPDQPAQLCPGMTRCCLKCVTSVAGVCRVQKEAAEYLATADCPSYLAKVERRLAEESERVKQYLDASTEPKITRVMEHELITQQMRSLVDMEHSGLLALLRHDKYEDLARMYSLFRRVPEGLPLVRSLMTDFVKEQGKQVVLDPERCKDPVDYVQRLLSERDKYERILMLAFSEDKTFRNALNHAFEYFVNLNQRSPEFISLFIDDKLRKGLKGMTDSDMEGVLDKVMALFRYLTEKDVFEKYYKQHLAKRLLAGRTVSDDAERNLLVKLKTECGYQFTSKLESMFTDIRTSRDLLLEFKSHLASLHQELPLDLTVQVLTTGSWPTQPASKCNLPRELDTCCLAFSNFYLQQHSGRKLTWQNNMGTADLRACFDGKRHELNVSTQQMCVLLLFNDTEQLTYKEIAEATEIPGTELKRALQSLSLIKGKNVLRKEPLGKDVSDDDKFIFNRAFTSKFFKVKISTVAASKEGESEKAETRHKVEEDRKPEIEAAIVRIMKARKTLDHNSIITEVTRQLSGRFLPNPAVIKKRIESLIEREFLARDEDDRRMYRYVA